MRLPDSRSATLIAATAVVSLGCVVGGHSVGATPPPVRSVHAEPGAAPVLDSARKALLPLAERGLAVAVAVLRNGEPVWLEGLGTPGPVVNAPVDPRTTRFRTYSVAKPMTAVAAARLAERGVLDPTAPIQRYVPDFFLPADSPPITAMHLATHTSGIRHYADEAEAASRRHCESVADALAIFAGDPLVHSPGARKTYSSWGFVLLSAVIEGASETRYAHAMENLVFAPTGMKHVAIDDPDSPASDRAVPLRTVRDGAPLPAMVVDNTCKWGAGGFLASAEDVARFGAAMLDEAFLSARSLALFVRGSDNYTARGGGVGGTALLWIDVSRRLSVALLANASGDRVDQSLAAALDHLRAGVSGTTPDSSRNQSPARPF